VGSLTGAALNGPALNSPALNSPVGIGPVSGGAGWSDAAWRGPVPGGGVLAHGLGGRTDLPLDGVTAIAGGGAAVAVTFLALTVAWTRPRLRPDAGRPLPAGLARLLDAAWPTRVARWVALVLSAAVVAVAFAGPSSDARNMAPWALFVTFWVGLVPVSALCGPVWRRVNPLRTLHAAVCRGARVDPAGLRAAPKRLG
jgi:hypothetical protein